MRKDHMKDGTICCIEECFIAYFEEVIKEYKPQMIIELGTYHGGMVKYFIEWMPNTPIYSIDSHWLIDLKDAKAFRNENVNILITSRIFKNEYILPMLLSLPIKKFLFCDNGWRSQEVKTFAGYLRPGDMMGTHDWGEDIKQEDVKHILNEFNDHKINKLIDEKNGLSCCRFWIKKDRGKEIKKQWEHKDETDRYNENKCLKA